MENRCLEQNQQRKLQMPTPHRPPRSRRDTSCYAVQCSHDSPKRHRRWLFQQEEETVVQRTKSIAWAIAAQQYVERGSAAAGRLIVACIFLFQAFYTFVWLNLVVTYPLEIVTYQMRSKACSYVLLVILRRSNRVGKYWLALVHLLLRLDCMHRLHCLLLLLLLCRDLLDQRSRRLLLSLTVQQHCPR